MNRIANVGDNRKGGFYLVVCISLKHANVKHQNQKALLVCFKGCVNRICDQLKDCDIFLSETEY